MNKTHGNCDIIVHRTAYNPTLQLNIAQITNYNKGRRRKTIIFNRKFEICNKNLFGLSDYASLYVISIINSFLNGAELKCPITQYQIFSVRYLTLNSKLIPLQLFYKPNSYVEVNGTFFEVNKVSSIYCGSFFLKVGIQKIFS